MLKSLSIAAGGAIGAVLRYWISGHMHKFFSNGFPWGTLSVNLIGSLIIGLLWGLFETVLLSQSVRLFIFIGLLGSFTTFSAFSVENFNLIQDEKYWLVFFNIAISVVLGIGLVFVGIFASRMISQALR